MTLGHHEGKIAADVESHALVAASVITGATCGHDALGGGKLDAATAEGDSCILKTVNCDL